jgi:cysteinyl-tRNA synthetase
VLGLFRSRPVPASPSQQDNTADRLMGLIIRLRNDARAAKNFALGDAIRQGLTEIGITLEDRPEGTLWRRA